MISLSVTIQLPSTEDGERFLWNIWFKNVSVVEKFQIIFDEYYDGVIMNFLRKEISL